MRHLFLTTSILLILIFLLGPIFTFLHELGHVAVPMLNGSKVIIVMGLESFNLFRFSIGSLEIVWNNTLLPWVGYARFDEPMSIAYLLGPLTSLSLFVFLRYFIVRKVRKDFLLRVSYSGAYWCLIQGAFTLAPIKYPVWLKGYEHFTSDGMKFIQSLM